MDVLFKPAADRMQGEADDLGNRLAAGGFKTIEEARLLVGQRKGLLRAIDILAERPTPDGEDDDD